MQLLCKFLLLTGVNVDVLENLICFLIIQNYVEVKWGEGMTVFCLVLSLSAFAL